MQPSVSICGLIKRSFTWDDHWGNPLEGFDISHMGKVTHGHEGTIDQPPYFSIELNSGWQSFGLLALFEGLSDA